MHVIRLYGLPNCDMTRAARKWLLQNGIEYEFQDYRETPVHAHVISEWIRKAGRSALVNRNSKTWKAFPEEIKNRSYTDDEVVELVQNYPTLIKRPVLEINGTILTGFKKDEYLSVFKVNLR